MPIARFQMEDGRIARFDVPEGTTPEQAQTLMQAHFSGNTAQSIKASNPGEYDPTSPEYKAKNTATGTFYENAMAGVGKAAVDTGRGIKGLFTDNSKDVLESRARDAELMKTGGGLVGNIGGNIGMMVTPGLALKGLAGVAGLAGAGRAGMALNTAGNSLIAPTTIPGALGLGAVTGAIQPASSMGERGLNTLIGGAAGAGGQAAFRGLSRMVSPNTSPEVRTLLNEGVTPTPGQILGGGFKRAEEGLTSLPIVGDAIKGGQRRAVDEFSNAAINRALQPIGARLPRGLQGHDAVAYAGDTLSARYDALMPRLTTSMDGQMIGELNQLRNSIGSGSINPVQAQQFERILNNDVLIKYQGPNATVTGETLKQIESDLGQLSKTYRTSPDPDQRLLGNALREVQAIVRGNVQRANPNAAPELRALNEGWANLVRVEKAAASQGAAKEG